MSEWQPIETAPLPKFSRHHWYNRRFACLIASEHGVALGVFSYAGGGVGVWTAYAIGPWHRVNPTHWMPLPEGPQS